MPTSTDRPRASARGQKNTGLGPAGPRRPPVSSARALQKLLDELGAARAALDAATAALTVVDARIRAWERPEGTEGAFVARRARALHDEATTRFATSLDELHGLLVRLADRSNVGPAFASRLRAPRTRRMQAKIRQELRGLQRAFDGGGALLARTISTFET